jgi:hypothetical protein
MKQHATPKPDDKAQSKRFIDTAHKVGADKGSAADADEVMGRLVKQAPEPRNKERAKQPTREKGR